MHVSLLFQLSAMPPLLMHPPRKKNKFYTALHRQFNLYKNKGIVILLGDFNAKMQKQMETDGLAIGPCTFDPENCTLDITSLDVLDNRERFSKILPTTTNS